MTASTVEEGLFNGLAQVFFPLGMPALTLPFVLVVWLFVLAGPFFSRLRAVAG